MVGHATICDPQVGVSKNWFNIALKWAESSEYFGKKHIPIINIKKLKLLICAGLPKSVTKL